MNPKDSINMNDTHQRIINNELDMLQGNIARLLMSNDLDELERMRDWAHRRIDTLTDARIRLLRNNTANNE